MYKRTVSIIVVSKRCDLYLKKCLDSISVQQYDDAEVLIINTSTDPGLNDLLSKDYPFILSSHRPQANYCQALNIGINMSCGEFVLCLNDDVMLEKGFIEEALEGFLFDRKVGMVSGKVLRFDKKTIDSTGLSVSIWRTAKERGYGSADKGQFEKAGFIFGVGGAVAFYSREMLEEAGLDGEYFDNDFGFFYEDLDIAWRAERLGFRGYYAPKAIAYHLRGLSVRKGKGLNKPYARRFLSDELYAALIRNRYLAMIKNESIFSFILHLPFIFLHDCASWVYTLLCKRKAIGIFFANKGCFRRAWRKRLDNPNLL